MAKSTSDTLRDLLGGITDDLKEAFDDLIDYDDRGRRWDHGRERKRDVHRRHREDDGWWRHREDDGPWRQREDDGRRRRADDHWDRERGRRYDEGEYDREDRRPHRSAHALPRQSGRGEGDGQAELREHVEVLRAELSRAMESLREAPDVRGTGGPASRRS
ncbi:hypothetical protein B9W68_05615 [Streptomyces sp. CS227]|uniref:hypothetical protein n=1 Tax=Streptomyces sp. CS227 TaxID=1982763 RepID=UPI000B415708|nr:hypothetical protein [Streptomyces sp. CS227]OWA18391.1 hypothetical protein B9W68_05615 [Streptomyces sp. CS227]